MKKEELKCLCLSDIHLNHKRNSTEDIIKNLVIFFKEYDYKGSLDIIFIAGDLFDSLMDFPANSVTEITVFVKWLLNLCCKNDIKLRILEGTPSHDWRQSKIFNTIAMVSELPVDLKYVDTLYIEYMDDLGIHILYVPDEWNHSTDKTYQQVKELLDREHIDKVDLAIMHGQFAYQLPSHVEKCPKHIESNYLSIVRHYICIGHVHISSVYERILAQGSFDRLSHNEESPKGAMYFIIRNNNTREHYFIENKNAKTFKTITCKSKDIEFNLKYIEKQTKGLRTDSYVRIKASKDNPILLSIDEVKKRFPFFNMSKVSFEEELESNQTELISENDNQVYTAINIDRENITSMLMDVVNNKYNPTELMKDIMLKELGGVL